MRSRWRLDETRAISKRFALTEAKFDFRCFFMSAPRVELYRKIDARVEGMMVGGIVDEAAWLLDSGLAPGENIPARSIGYRPAMEFLLCRRQRRGREWWTRRRCSDS